MGDLFSNPTISALVGVAVGGLISYVAGVGLARRQRRDTHRAAVRAVVYELTENLAKVKTTNPGRLSTSTYDGLLVPLYTDLPDAVSNQVSLAYTMLHANGPVPNFLVMPMPQVKLMRTAVQDAQTMLRTYAEKKLKITFVPTP